MIDRTSAGGLIGLFVRHPTASNLLMVAMIVIGLYSLQRLNTQFFPTIEIPQITVTVSWPGASATDVEQNILDALEPELRFLDGVDEVLSVAREGSGVITIEFNSDADMQKALSDVEQAVDGVTTLPEDSEEPVIRRITFFEPVARIALSGPFSEQVLKAYAKRLRDGLLGAGIDKVSLVGARDEEIWVRVKEAELRRLDLTLSDIGQRIREDTRDLPSGVVEGDVELQLRSLSKRRTPDTLAQIEVKSERTGEKVRLGEIAEVQTRFERQQSIGQQGRAQAIELSVQRAVSADTLKTMHTLDTYLAKVLPTLPASLKIEKYDVRGKFVQQRLGILLKNGLQGLVLVLIILFIFLDARVAFWVAVGIPVAFMATLAVMWASGQTINMVSMFALIMMLGIIVDDAIVVGEHTATRQQLGDTRLEAAERGASRMLMPVFAATLTTQAAFFPIFLIRDRLGDIMQAIPLVVVAVLIASLIECFLILPGHLRHGFGKRRPEPGRFRRVFDRGLNSFRDGPYNWLVRTAYGWRYTTVAFTIAMLVFSMGLIAGGRIGFSFFPSPEPENIVAYVTFGAGTPRAE
ncbi:MAG: efflux RND transporter permease subunit, partial [Methyloligellaceae bacterium]